MGKKKLTKKEFENYLNRMGEDAFDVASYGSHMRKNDSIMFELSYNEWVRDMEDYNQYEKNVR